MQVTHAHSTNLPNFSFPHHSSFFDRSSSIISLFSQCFSRTPLQELPSAALFSPSVRPPASHRRRASRRCLPGRAPAPPHRCAAPLGRLQAPPLGRWTASPKRRRAALPLAATCRVPLQLLAIHRAAATAALGSMQAVRRPAPPCCLAASASSSSAATSCATSTPSSLATCMHSSLPRRATVAPLAAWSQSSARPCRRCCSMFRLPA